MAEPTKGNGDTIPKIVLPTAKAPKITDLSRQRILLYGPPKVGKSTWCSRAPDAVFLDCENGLQSLECFKVPCRNWGEICGTVQALRNDKHPYKTVIVDSIGVAYRWAQEHVLTKHKSEWLTDGSLAWGKGTGLVTNSVVWLLKALSDPLLGLGLYVIAHERQETVKDRFGGEIIRTGPDIPDKVVQYVVGWADMVLRAGYENEGEGDATVIKRVLISQGSESLIAGDRTGCLPAVMPLSFPAMEKTYNEALNGKSKKK